MIIVMTILRILILPWKTQNYISLPSLYQQMTTNKYQNFLVKDLKDWFIGMNIKQTEKRRIQQIVRDILMTQTLWELTDCLFWFIQTKTIVKRFNYKKL